MVNISRDQRVFKIPLVLLAFAIILKGINTKRVIKGQKKVKIWSYESRGKSYPDMKPIHIMLTDSLCSVIGVNNHRKDVILFSKTFPDGWQKRATKSP